jgi:hypothetical protein
MTMLIPNETTSTRRFTLGKEASIHTKIDFSMRRRDPNLSHNETRIYSVQTIPTSDDLIMLMANSPPSFLKDPRSISNSN